MYIKVHSNRAYKGKHNKGANAPLHSNKVRFSCDEYFTKYMKVLSHTEFSAYSKRSLAGFSFIDIDKAQVEELDRRQEKRAQEDALLAETAELNNKGTALEKEGRIDDAIEVYERNIALGYKATHSFDRLVILYHKRKDTENEKRVVFRAREVFCDNTMYDKRLSRIEKTKQKA